MEAAAATTGQTISHQLLRLLHKFAHHAGEGPAPARAEAESMLRRNVARLITDWELEDPNPGSYTAVLDGMVRESPGAPASAEEPLDCEAETVLQIALEIGCPGPRVTAAMELMLSDGRLGRLIGALRAAPESSKELAPALWERVATPARLREVLAAPHLDFPAIEGLAGQLGPEPPVGDGRPALAPAPPPPVGGRGGGSGGQPVGQPAGRPRQPQQPRDPHRDEQRGDRYQQPWTDRWRDPKRKRQSCDHVARRIWSYRRRIDRVEQLRDGYQ